MRTSSRRLPKAFVDSLPDSQSLPRCTKPASADSSSLPANYRHGFPPSVKIREASFEDYPQIVALESKYGLETKCNEEWKHLWCNNPAYRQYQKSLPIGWVLEGEDRTIVGSLGNIPLFYEFEGRRLLASVAHAWVIDVPY